jgi:hypothetical protein
LFSNSARANSAFNQAKKDAKETDLRVAKRILIQQKIVSENLISAM